MVAAPAIVGDDPLAHERIWDKLYWTMLPRGQTGYGAHALAQSTSRSGTSKGKALDQPVWRLLDGDAGRWSMSRSGFTSSSRGAGRGGEV